MSIESTIYVKLNKKRMSNKHKYKQKVYQVEIKDKCRCKLGNKSGCSAFLIQYCVKTTCLFAKQILSQERLWLIQMSHWKWNALNYEIQWALLYSAHFGKYSTLLKKKKERLLQYILQYNIISVFLLNVTFICKISQFFVIICEIK